MNQGGKGAEWRELFTLSADDVSWMKYSSLCPAVQLTVALFERDFRFSHTLGVLDREGAFRPIQHLHHRNVANYRFLLGLTDFAVEAVKGVGVENALLARAHLKKHFLKAVGAAACKPEEFREQVPRRKLPRVKSGRVEQKPWGASIGEMIDQGRFEKGQG